MLLAQDARLLLVDEPAAGMTDGETQRTGELLLSLAGRHSIIVIKHDMTFIRQISKGGKVTVLHQGHVLCEGTVDEFQNVERVKEVYLGRKARAACFHHQDAKTMQGAPFSLSFTPPSWRLGVSLRCSPFRSAAARFCAASSAS